jgi:hypothetical protein
MTPEKYMDNWQSIKDNFTKGGANNEAARIFNSTQVEVINKIGDLTKPEKLKVFASLDNLFKGVAKLDPNDPNAEKTLSGLLRDYYIASGDAIAKSGKIKPPDLFGTLTGILGVVGWTIAGSSVGYLQGRYAYNPRQLRPDLVNSTTWNRFATYKDATVIIAGLMKVINPAFGYSMAGGAVLARVINSWRPRDGRNGGTVDYFAPF